MCVCVYVCVHVYVKRVCVHVRCRTTSTARRKVVSAKRQFIEFVRLGQGIVRKNEMSLFHQIENMGESKKKKFLLSLSFSFSPHTTRLNVSLSLSHLSLSLSLISSLGLTRLKREGERNKNTCIFLCLFLLSPPLLIKQNSTFLSLSL